MKDAQMIHLPAFNHCELTLIRQMHLKLRKPRSAYNPVYLKGGILCLRA
jgi:hypothetical protein